MNKQPCTIEVNFRTDVIPPRCRKPRCVELTETLDLYVPEVKKGEAPIVATITLTDLSGYKWDQDVRLWNNMFYTRRPINYAGAKPDKYAEWEPHTTLNLSYVEDFSVTAEEIKADMSSNLLIEGEWWQPCGIPIFHISIHGGFNYRYISLELDFIPQQANKPAKLRRLQYSLTDAEQAYSCARDLVTTLNYKESFADLDVKIVVPKPLTFTPFVFQVPDTYPTFKDQILAAINSAPDTLSSHDLERITTSVSEERSTWFQTNTVLGAEHYYKS
jgi:hypothetical protein